MKSVLFAPTMGLSSDVESQKFLRSYDLKYYKIASAMVVYEDLLREVALEGKHTLSLRG